jgi:NADH-quinone oxidoreductase subunit A
MSYFPVLVLFLFAITIGVVILLIGALLGKGIPNKRKDMPFECGLPASNIRYHRVPVRFYLVGILFLLFDVEIVFLYPWAIVYKKYLSFGPYIIGSMLFFFVTLLVGYLYLLGKNVFEWE